ncbi:unnamed protein product [Lepidochelys kempii]
MSKALLPCVDPMPSPGVSSMGREGGRRKPSAGETLAPSPMHPTVCQLWGRWHDPKRCTDPLSFGAPMWIMPGLHVGRTAQSAKDRTRGPRDGERQSKVIAHNRKSGAGAEQGPGGFLGSGAGPASPHSVSCCEPPC